MYPAGGMMSGVCFGVLRGFASTNLSRPRYSHLRDVKLASFGFFWVVSGMDFEGVEAICPTQKKGCILPFYKLVFVANKHPFF